MRRAFFFLSLVMATMAHAAVIEGEISTVDLRASTITVTMKGRVATFRVRPDTEVLVNGARSKFPALAPKMAVKVTAADPTVASRVEAKAAEAPPAPPADGAEMTGPEKRAAFFGVKIKPGSLEDGPEAPLAAELVDSKWRLNDGRIITLRANGIAEGSWPGSQGTWKATSATTLEWTLSPKATQPSAVTLDKNINNATWKDEFGQVRTAKKVPRPL